MATPLCRIAASFVGWVVAAITLLHIPGAVAEQFGTPKENEGTRIFGASEHPYYSGRFRLSGRSATLIGSVNDRAPWDLWVRSKEHNTNNFPPFETFVHLYWDEVTWK